MSAQTLPAAALAEIEAAGLTPEQTEILRRVWRFAFDQGFGVGRRQSNRLGFQQGELVAEHAALRQEMDDRSRYAA